MVNESGPKKAIPDYFSEELAQTIGTISRIREHYSGVNFIALNRKKGVQKDVYFYEDFVLKMVKSLKPETLDSSTLVTLSGILEKPQMEDSEHLKLFQKLVQALRQKLEKTK